MWELQKMQEHFSAPLVPQLDPGRGKTKKAFVITWGNWHDHITNYFVRRETRGFVEGLNNKIKVIKRRCYGIYNLGRLFQHIWLDIQGRRVLFAER